jgi:hypothetical protein
VFVTPAGWPRRGLGRLGALAQEVDCQSSR